MATVLAECYAQLATTTAQWEAVKRLFTSYIDELGEDYSVGGCNLIEEIASLPEPYIGRSFVLLGYHRNEAVGCLALKEFSSNVGEVRRMFVSKEGRGKGLGRLMLSDLMLQGKAHGYEKLYLDSLHRFTSAHRIYFDAGFQLREPYDPATTQAMRDHMYFMEKTL